MRISDWSAHVWSSDLHDPLPRQRSLVLGERAEQREQQLAMRRGGIHLFRQRPEGDAAFLEVGDDRQQVRQRAAEPIELPDNQRVAVVHVVEAGYQAGAIVARPGSLA